MIEKGSRMSMVISMLRACFKRNDFSVKHAFELLMYFRVTARKLRKRKIKYYLRRMR